MIEEKRALNIMKNDKPDDIDFGRLLGDLIDGKWLITGISILTLILGMLYVILAKPTYRAEALIQVEQNLGNSVLNNLSQIFPSTQPDSAPEIELIKSRMILGQTVDELNLTTRVEENNFWGGALSRLINKKRESINVSKFEVPDSLRDNKEITLTIESPEFYTIEKDGDIILKGKVGVIEKKDGITILVDSIDADKDSSFTLTKISFMDAISGILDNLDVADKGKDTGMLGLSFTGNDPILIKKILDRISRIYLEQNITRKSEESAKSLEFLQQQLPIVRRELDQAEEKLNSYRQTKDSVDLSMEAKSMLDSLVSVDGQLNELTFKESDISKLYTKEHPAYKALIEKRNTLIEEKNRINAQINKMPKTQQEILRLSRDVQSGQEIYMQLLNRQQELSIAKASVIGNVRIIDGAITLEKPVAPKKGIIIVASFIIGLLLSSAYIIVSNLLRKGIRSPEQLEEKGINVYASIPLSAWQVKRDLEFLKRKGKRNSVSNSLLAIENPADLAIEAIRSLRTSLHFAMMEAKNNILMISGASPSIGKTFVSANMAAVIAQAGQKVLFIDSDMRKGYAHVLLGGQDNIGLSDFLVANKSIDEVVQSTSAGFDFIARGTIPPNPSELLMHTRFSEIVKWASNKYDLVIIDTPPILAVTDPAIVGKHAGTALMVARFESNTPNEVEVSIRRFEQNGISIKGVILNAVVKKASNYYSYGYDAYEYSYKPRE